ncbi:AIDA repeat-containing protein, partial [Escherichia coli]|uniref:AIDA repeat-containing protein n=1 Tax=Escherichia coli TaxID=562 RepID=UPI0038B2D149
MAFTEEVNGGFTVDGETVENGTQYVRSGGTANNTTINNDGTQNVSGTANNTTINDAGRQDVRADGTATGTIINDDGIQFVWADGTANNT